MTRTAKNKRKQKWRIPVIIIAVVLALLILPQLLFPAAPGGTSAPAAASNLRSATAEMGSITTSVSGSGTLISADAEDITIPSGVEIDTVFVSAGDQVHKGDLLATVDRDSVLTALADVQSQLDDLDEQLKDKADDKVSASVKAGVSGRVKLVWAGEGDSAAAVTAQYGGLVVLSLDGKMAVALPISSAVSIGSDVAVTLSDGETQEGVVSEYTSDGMVVTLTDNGPVYGDVVTVATEDGVSLGSGLLYIHTPLTITGYTGTVSSVKVKENETVSASSVLLKLSDLGHTAEYNALLAQRETLAGQMQTLTALYQDNTVTAPFDGTVQSVSSDSEAAAGTETSVSDYTSGFTGFTGFSMPTTSSGISVRSNATTSDEPEQPAAEQPSEPAQTEQPSEPTQTEQPSTPAQPEQQPAGAVSVQLAAAIVLNGGQIGDYAGQFTLNLAGDGVLQQKVNDASGVVVFDPLTFDQPGAYLYQLTQIPGTDAGIQYDTASYVLLVQISAGTDGKLTAAVVPEMSNLIFTNSVGTQPSDQTGTDTPGSVIPGDLGDLGDLSGLGDLTGLGDLGGSSISIGGFGDLGSMGSLDTSALSGDSLTQSLSSGSGSETTVLTLSPNDHMTVRVTVDELDILSVSKGQTATVTIDALDGEAVQGIVTGIDTNGSASGGVTKYTIEVTVDKTERMLSNMNASVEIVISQSEGCLLIPEAALNQSGTRTFVYTGCDETTGEPTGEQEVATGLSDGTNVEITSGLSEGDTVYYSYNDAGYFPYYSFAAGNRAGGRQ